MTEQIIFCGKGGVGISTLISNTSAALAEAGFSVMQIGCNPKADSCSILTNGFPIPTVCDQMRKSGGIPSANVIHKGFKGIDCVELGDSGTPIAMQRVFDRVEQAKIFEAIQPDYTLYDISGEHSSAVYLEQIHQRGSSQLFVVTTADFMSLRAANTIYATLEQPGASRAAIPFAGLIANGICNSLEESFINDFAQHTHTRALGMIPRSIMVRQCELYGKTVIEAAPLSNQSYYYRRLANRIVDRSIMEKNNVQPQAMNADGLRSWAREWGDRLFAMENGLVTDGAAI